MKNINNDKTDLFYKEMGQLSLNNTKITTSTGWVYCLFPQIGDDQTEKARGSS